MQDATVERLSKIISERRQDDGKPGGNGPLHRRPTIQLHLGLAEGWFSLFLLAAIVYSTIWCVQAADWVDNLNVLTPITAIGLIGGVVAAKQRRFPRFLVHTLAVVFGILLAFWQTTAVDYSGNTSRFFNSVHQWTLLVLAGGTSSDDSIFLFLIIALSFMLAYTSAWLVYRTRSPWLMILANAIVLLINLSYIEPGYIVFLVVFLVASLLLLLRINLYESSMRWKRLGLRCADDIGWEFMQAGALISIGILIVSWFIPWGYTSDAAAQIWSADNNPWVQIQNTWNRIFAVSGGYNPANHGNFTDTLTLGGNPNLTNDIVLTVKTDDGTQYLESLSYDTYNGRGWQLSPTYGSAYSANNVNYDQSSDVRVVHEQITIVNPPGEQKAYILGASQIASLDQPAQIVSSSSNGAVVAWLRTNGKLAAGNQYNVISYVSAADIKTLESVPMPANAPTYPSNFDGPISVNYYDPNILHTYLQLPPNLDPRILQVAKEQTASASSMYDKALALQSYLQSFTYDTNVTLPPGVEGTSWLLFDSGHRAFCNYFATAMAVMARELGMPARVVAGYTHGTYDPKTKEWVVRGSDAHLWTQIYFAGYGWVNFEPSPGFKTFDRPTSSTGSTIPLPPLGAGGSTTGKNNGRGRGLPNESGDTGAGVPTTPAQAQAQVRQDIGISLFAIILLIALGLLYFSFWWRRLFRGQTLSAQIYGRLCLLANWAGISIQRSQTPYEYVHALADAAPDQAVTLERLGDIYVRDRWADPSTEEHPRRSGEIRELPSLWKRLQPRLFLYVLRHPHFLKWLPASVGGLIGKWRRRRRVRKISDDL
jgi:transglutaminase-like putative cysteine protease